ncbi:MAG: two-component sensor histidine kinase [Chloroflexus sp.]|uniref:sensor histidine kinase n=1 Tax=Chloroflexus sp. TaxID=1904827 RepID=UPI0021DCD022|nr:ATP-binding protein [Chloroflexus sp.]GIV87516.1 MAG: two-component sensor histidine kinase [Chloroflexus sp.]
MNAWLRRGSLRQRLLLTHMVTIAVGALTLGGVTILFAPSIHDRLMIAWLGPQWVETADASMVEMERATNAIFTLAMMQALLISSGVAIAVAVPVSLVASQGIVRPIERLLATAQQIADGHYHERVPLQGDRELVRLAAQFNTIAAALEQAEQRRVTLIGDVAHELRTPLATIAGYVEGVLDGVVEADEDTWVLVLDEVNRLHRLAGDLQELSRVEAKQIVLARQNVHLEPLIEAICARLEPQFTEKGVRLQVQLANGLPSVWVDPDRILQVLMNLVGNALQYTPRGGSVTIRALVVEKMVRVCVHDTGIGIAAEHLPHLFERFYRVDKARARATGGVGIGLTICKALVELHGGQIGIHSDGPGQGATCWFTLPLFDHNVQRLGDALA